MDDSSVQCDNNNQVKGPHKWNGNFRIRILSRLQQRDRRESKGFTELFQHHEKLFDNWAMLRAENLRLSIAVERGLNDRTSGTGISEEREKQLEHKILSLQEEVTELHRRRGENASQVLALSAKLTDREAELDLNRTACATAVAKTADLEEQVKFLQSCLHEREATNELLRDEHQALHLAYTSIDEKFRKLQKENQELLQRYIEIKAKHADIMNQANEDFVKQKQAQVRRELEEAASEMKMGNLPTNSPPKSFVNPCDITVLSSLGIVCTVPGTPSKPFEAHESEVTAVRWNPNGKQFATAGQDRKVKIWEPGKTDCPELRSTLSGSNGSILCLDFDASGTYLVAASHDFASRIWSVEDGRLRHTLTGHSAKVNTTKFLGDSSRVVSGSSDRTLKVWDLKSRACVSTKFAGSSCHDIISLTEGNGVISGHYDKTIRFWDLRSDSPSQEVILPEKITSLDLSNNQNFLLASVRDDALHLFDLRMNSVIGQYTADGFRVSSDISRAVFSPDAQYGASGSLDGTIYVWNLIENHLESILKQHSSAVGSIHWHPKGISLITGDKTRKVILWAP